MQAVRINAVVEMNVTELYEAKALIDWVIIIKLLILLLFTDVNDMKFEILSVNTTSIYASHILSNILQNLWTHTGNVWVSLTRFYETSTNYCGFLLLDCCIPTEVSWDGWFSFYQNNRSINLSKYNTNPPSWRI